MVDLADGGSKYLPDASQEVIDLEIALEDLFRTAIETLKPAGQVAVAEAMTAILADYWLARERDIPPRIDGFALARSPHASELFGSLEKVTRQILDPLEQGDQQNIACGLITDVLADYTDDREDARKRFTEASLTNLRSEILLLEAPSQAVCDNMEYLIIGMHTFFQHEGNRIAVATQMVDVMAGFLVGEHIDYKPGGDLTEGCFANCCALEMVIWRFLKPLPAHDRRVVGRYVGRVLVSIRDGKSPTKIPGPGAII